MNEAESSLNAALRAFETAEANLAKLERVWAKAKDCIPDGINFTSDPEYDELCRSFSDIAGNLPAIDGWRIESRPLDLNEIAQRRLDAEEIGEIGIHVSLSEALDAPARDIAEYRFRIRRKRKQLIRDSLDTVVSRVDQLLANFGDLANSETRLNNPIPDEALEPLRRNIAELDTLLGNTVPRSERWGVLQRHLAFGLIIDLRDIIQHDWPDVRSRLQTALYEEDDPIPVGVEDLGLLVASKPRGPVATKMKWGSLSEEEFERLLFNLIGYEHGYENPQWLTRTKAPDRGRDLSVTRISQDALAGVIRLRVIIQCRHWLTHSVSVGDVATLKEQMKLWEPPLVDVLVIATSGRFSSDAVVSIEKQNQADSRLKIEMWPESHLEHVLASRPQLIGEFRLR